MSHLNKVILLGTLTILPEEKYLSSGVSVCKFNLVTNENWKDKAGEWQQKSEFHKIVCWNKISEYISKQARVGDKILVEGKLQTQVWEKEGIRRYITEVNASSVKIVFSKSSKKEQVEQTEKAKAEYSSDDIPF